MSDRTTSEVAIHNRMDIPLFQAGKDGPSIWSAGVMNVLVRVLRALVNPRVVWGESDNVQITDGNFLITLSRTSANEDGNAKVQQYVLTDASNGNYFICRHWSEGPFEPIIGLTDIYIAKPFHLRQSPFDRDVLNAAAPGNIGTSSEIPYRTVVESWDGVTFSSATKKWSYQYKSATFRIATDETDATPSNWTSQNQTIIPRFVPAFLSEPEGGDVTTITISPTIIYAAQCSGLEIFR